MKASEHILEIDIAKGIGIVCVFIGHLTFWGTPVSKFVDFLLHGVRDSWLLNILGKAGCIDTDCVLSTRTSNPIVLFACTTHFATCNNRFVRTDAFATLEKLARSDR